MNGMFISYFPDDMNPNGVGIQLAKTHWFNQNGKGIHFETWVTEKEIETQKLKFALHILHQDYFPNTEKKPWDFIWPFVDDEFVIEYVSKWNGFKMGRTVPLKGERRFKESTSIVIGEEFTRFLALGESIDRILKKTLK